uniref:RanBP2-type domain-containing protein n=2 Tax=Lotharella globosa TaxID=91324 RepID=A0A7S3Y9V2_9EUKA
MVGACLSLPPKAHWRCRMCSNVNIPARTICGVCGSGDKEFVVEKKDPKTQQSKPKKRKFVKKAIELRCVSSSAEHKAAEDLVTIVASYDKKPPYEAQVMGMSVFSRSKSSSGDSKKEGHMGEQLVDTKLIHSSTFERRHEVLMTLTLSKTTKYLITPWLVRGHTYRVSVFSRSSVWSMRNMLVPPESTAISEEMKKYDQAVHQPNPKDVEELTKMGYSVARSRLAIMECEDRGGGMAKWLDWLARNPHEPEAEKKILCKDQPTKEQASKRGHSESSEGAKSHPPSQSSIETKVESGMSVKVKGNERYWLVCALVAGGHWVVQRAGEPKALKAHTEKYIAESWRILDVGDAAEKHDVVKELKVQRLIEEKDFVRLLEVVKIIAKKEGVRREVDPPTQKDTRDKEAITKKVLKGKDVITLLGNALQNETQYSIDDVFRKITEAWGT